MAVDYRSGELRAEARITGALMSWISRVVNLFRSSDVDRALDDEIGFHIESRIDELVAADAVFTELARSVSDQRSQAFFEGDGAISKSIQLMNFHQTKGREADAVILVYREDDWFGREEEPFPTNSRLLYVSLTRARQRNIVILPPSPHPLVSPFAQL